MFFATDAVDRVPYIMMHGGFLLPLFAALVVGLSGQNVFASIFAWKPIELLGLQVARALEHQVLEEMGETRSPGRIVLRADLIPDLHGDRRARVILGRDDLESIREMALREDDGRYLQRRRRLGSARGEDEEGECVCGERCRHGHAVGNRKARRYPEIAAPVTSL